MGYVGRDVESIVRDLVETSIDMVRDEKLDEIEDRAELLAEDRLIELLLEQGAGPDMSPAAPAAVESAAETKANGVIEMPREAGKPEPVVEGGPAEAREEASQPTLVVVSKNDAERAQERERLRAHFREGRLDNRTVQLDTRERNTPHIEVMTGGQAPEDFDANGFKDMLSGMLNSRTRRREMKVADAFEYLVQEEESRLLDMDAVTRIAIERVENQGIVFLDEIDKIAGREGSHGPDISREGVQRDILPIVEGTTVNTKYGMVTTDHILFIAAGAFHVSKPSDLIPELQGRFPIRVELHSLTVEDFLRILTEPRASLIKQSIALLETEGITLEFAPEALNEMARFAFEVNETTENIGARRLQTILEKVLDEISFHAPDLVKPSTETSSLLGDAAAKLPSLEERSGENGVSVKALRVTREYVIAQVAGIVKNQDLSRYIL